MPIEVIIWLMVNMISLVVSHFDFWETRKVYKWAQLYGHAEHQRVSRRSYRLATTRVTMATLFVIAGIIAVSNFVDNSWIAWALVSASVVLTADVVLDARYRRRVLFKKPPEGPIDDKGDDDAVGR